MISLATRGRRLMTMLLSSISFRQNCANMGIPHTLQHRDDEGGREGGLGRWGGELSSHHACGGPRVNETPPLLIWNLAKLNSWFRFLIQFLLLLYHLPLSFACTCLPALSTHSSTFFLDPLQSAPRPKAKMCLPAWWLKAHICKHLTNFVDSHTASISVSVTKKKPNNIVCRQTSILQNNNQFFSHLHNAYKNGAFYVCLKLKIRFSIRW